MKMTSCPGPPRCSHAPATRTAWPSTLALFAPAHFRNQTTMSLWTTLNGWFRQDRQQLLVEQLAAEGPTAQAGVHYFRVKLAEMFLRQRVDWCQTLYPAVHSLVSCKF